MRNNKNVPSLLRVVGGYVLYVLILEAYLWFLAVFFAKKRVKKVEIKFYASILEMEKRLMCTIF